MKEIILEQLKKLGLTEAFVKIVKDSSDESKLHFVIYKDLESLKAAEEVSNG